MIKLNKNKLKSVMVLHGDKNEDLARILSVSPQRFSMKINEKDGAQFNQNEIALIKERYSLNAEDLDNIFLT